MPAALTAPLELLYPVHRFSVEDYHRMIETGILGDEDRVELLNGKILEMSPIGRFHAVCVRKINKLFVRRLAEKYVCSQEQPITIADGSEPEPDYVVASTQPHDYLEHHPRPEDIHLLIEVADKTLERDRNAKAIIYAKAEIPEYWVVNLIDRQLEIYTDPDKISGQYLQKHVLEENGTIQHPLIGNLDLAWILP